MLPVVIGSDLLTFFHLCDQDPSMKSNGLRNPFDIPRHSLLDQLVRMRANFLQVSRDSPNLSQPNPGRRPAVSPC